MIDGERSLQAGDADRKREKQQDRCRTGREVGTGHRSRTATRIGTYRNKGQGKRRRGTSRDRKRQGLGGARTQREQKKTEREREAEGQPELSPSLPGCLSARLRSASPKPVLKLLRVAARKPGGRQPNWKAADGQLPGRRAPRRWRWDKETPWPPALHLHPVRPSQGQLPHPAGCGLDGESFFRA